MRLADDRDLVVADHGRIRSLGAVWSEQVEQILVTTLAGAGDASLASLRRALMNFLRRRERAPRYAEQFGPHPPRSRAWIGFLAPAEERRFPEIDDGYDQEAMQYLDVPPTSPAVFLDGDRIRVRFVLVRRDRPDVDQVEGLLGPFLERHRGAAEARVSEVEEFEPEGPGFRLTVDLDVDFRRGAKLVDAWRLGDEARALVKAVDSDSDELTQAIALDLLKARHWQLFHGQPETHWLEAKGDPYDSEIRRLGKNWRFELAKDVASFANSPEGGLIVIGMTTEDHGDGDVIRGHKEFDLSRVTASTYRRHVAQLVYPRVRGLDVVRIPGADPARGLAALVIPPQPPSSLPFLVRGVVNSAGVMGNHVLWPVRREDDVALMDADALHTRLRLGDRFVREEQDDPRRLENGELTP